MPGVARLFSFIGNNKFWESSEVSPWCHFSPTLKKVRSSAEKPAINIYIDLYFLFLYFFFVFEIRLCVCQMPTLNDTPVIL